MRRGNITIIAIGFLAILLFGKTVLAREYYQLPGVMHVHSTFSSGRYSIEELVAKAKEKDLEVLVLTDHDQVVMEYGVFPLRNLIKRREERNSVLQVGPEVYLSEIKRLNQEQQSVLVVVGAESSPFYYWSGNPFREGLTAHDYSKELLLIGLSTPDDYHDLPLLHGKFSLRYVEEFLPRFLLFFAAFLLAVYLIFQKGRSRVAGIVITLISTALMINYHPFKSSRFNPYRGGQGIAPYQEIIDYTKARGGLVFWAHPESNYFKSGPQLGPIKMMTGHYPDNLIKSKNYTGFAALYGDSSTAANPGMHWDQILINYCRGRRGQPVWAIAESDFHEERKGFDLDTYQTVFLVKDKRNQDVLQALERGSFYAVRKSTDSRLKLDHFQVKSKTTGSEAIMGEELKVKETPIINGKLSALDGSSQEITITILRHGKIAWTFEGQTPLDFHLIDQDGWSGKTYYRLDVKSDTGGHLLSNPIFVTRTQELN
jgi:hypothetical protein